MDTARGPRSRSRCGSRRRPGTSGAVPFGGSATAFAAAAGGVPIRATSLERLPAVRHRLLHATARLASADPAVEAGIEDVRDGVTLEGGPAQDVLDCEDCRPERGPGGRRFVTRAPRRQYSCKGARGREDDERRDCGGEPTAGAAAVGLRPRERRESLPASPRRRRPARLRSRSARRGPSPSPSRSRRRAPAADPARSPDTRGGRSRDVRVEHRELRVADVRRLPGEAVEERRSRASRRRRGRRPAGPRSARAPRSRRCRGTSRSASALPSRVRLARPKSQR